MLSINMLNFPIRAAVNMQGIVFTIARVSTRSRNGRLFTLNEIPPKRVQSLFFLLLQLLDAQQPDSITTQVCRNDLINPMVTITMLSSFYLMPTLVTTASAVCGKLGCSLSR